MELIHLALALVAIPIMAELAVEDGTAERVDTPFHHTLLDLILKAVVAVQAMFTHHPQLKTIHQVVY